MSEPADTDEAPDGFDRAVASLGRVTGLPVEDVLDVAQDGEIVRVRMTARRRPGGPVGHYDAVLDREGQLLSYRRLVRGA